MPTYEYVCMSCERHVEAVQSFSDEPLRTCEFCGGPLKRVFHPVGIVLKGSGFYSTDNRASRSKASSSEPKKESGAETKSSETKSDTSKPKPDSSSSKPSPSKGDGGSKS